MIRAARYAYLVLAWAFLAGLAVQVFFAGLGIFAGATNFETHVNFGYLLHLSPILILAAAALSRAGSRHWRWALGLVVAVFVIPFFVYLRDSTPALAALHPVAAVLASWVALRVALNSLTPIRDPDPADVTPETATT
ncbi:MAG TPA: DUF6220 domain-containing protein [Candidatus Limnocylindria bacterium]|nr:DUF6220 domain-containing protein [Candidatus Limnocylindria bacterium]